MPRHVRTRPGYRVDPPPPATHRAPAWRRALLVGAALAAAWPGTARAQPIPSELFTTVGAMRITYDPPQAARDVPRLEAAVWTPLDEPLVPSPHQTCLVEASLDGQPVAGVGGRIHWVAVEVPKDKWLRSLPVGEPRSVEVVMISDLPPTRFTTGPDGRASADPPAGTGSSSPRAWIAIADLRRGDLVDDIRLFCAEGNR